MQRQLEDERRSRLQLEASNASLQRENEFLRDRFDRAIENERETLKMLANIGTQSRYGITPYPESKGLPEQGVTEQPTPARVQGMDIVRERTTQFLNDYEKRFPNGTAPVPVERLREFAAAL